MSIVSGIDFASEREPGRWYCCSACCAAMAAHALDPAKHPATLAYAHRIKQLSGRVHDGGMTPQNVMDGLAKIGVASVFIAKSLIPKFVADGYVVIVPHDYGRLTTHLRRWQPRFTGGHSGLLAGRRSSDGKMGWFDPLAPQGWSGEWVRWEDIDQAVWSSGAIAVKKYVAPPKPATPPAATLKYGGKAMSQRKTVKVAAARVRAKPSTTQGKVVRTLAKGATFAARQYTDSGSKVAGSRRWYGTRDGSKWVHSSLVTSSGAIRNNETVR